MSTRMPKPAPQQRATSWGCCQCSSIWSYQLCEACCSSTCQHRRCLNCTLFSDSSARRGAADSAPIPKTAAPAPRVARQLERRAPVPKPKLIVQRHSDPSIQDQLANTTDVWTVQVGSKDNMPPLPIMERAQNGIESALGA